MKKILLTAIIVALIGTVGFASTASHAQTISNLLAQYSDLVTWASSDPYARCSVAAPRMNIIVSAVTIEAIKAIQEATTPQEAQLALAIVYMLVGMDLGAEGVQELNNNKVTVATEIIGWSVDKINRITP